MGLLADLADAMDTLVEAFDTLAASPPSKCSTLLHHPAALAPILQGLLINMGSILDSWTSSYLDVWDLARAHALSEAMDRHLRQQLQTPPKPQRPLLKLTTAIGGIGGKAQQKRSSLHNGQQLGADYYIEIAAAAAGGANGANGADEDDQDAAVKEEAWRKKVRRASTEHAAKNVQWKPLEEDEKAGLEEKLCAKREALIKCELRLAQVERELEGAKAEAADVKEKMAELGASLSLERMTNNQARSSDRPSEVGPSGNGVLKKKGGIFSKLF